MQPTSFLQAQRARQALPAKPSITFPWAPPHAPPISALPALPYPAASCAAVQYPRPLTLCGNLVTDLQHSSCQPKAAGPLHPQPASSLNELILTINSTRKAFPVLSWEMRGKAAAGQPPPPSNFYRKCQPEIPSPAGIVRKGSG